MNEKVIKMIEKSEVTGILYDSMDCVFFRNLYQIAFYVDHNAKIIDVFTDSKGMLVFCFLKSDHEKLIKLWMENKENKGKGS